MLPKTFKGAAVRNLLHYMHYRSETIYATAIRCTGGFQGLRSIGVTWAVVSLSLSAMQRLCPFLNFKFYLKSSKQGGSRRLCSMIVFCIRRPLTEEDELARVHLESIALFDVTLKKEELLLPRGVCAEVWRLGWVYLVTWRRFGAGATHREDCQASQGVGCKFFRTPKHSELPTQTHREVASC